MILSAYLQLMFAFPMLDKVLNLIDGDNQFQNIWELRAIRFDVDPDEDRKPFEKYIVVSYNVEDNKGNPGMRGHLFVTNLRIIWQLAADHYINLSIGWDTVIGAAIKTLPVGGGNNFKYLLSLKTQNLSQNRYEFKFMGFSEEDLNVFNKINEMHKKISMSKNYRNINLAIKCDPEFQVFDAQEVKTTYTECQFTEDGVKLICKIVLTDVRIIILKPNEKTMNYSIPWLMVKSVDKIQQNDRVHAKLHCRGIMTGKQLYFHYKKVSQIKKLYIQMKTFSETYNKTPILGYVFQKTQSKLQEESMKGNISNRPEIEEIEDTKVKLRKRNNAYQSNQGMGLLEQTQFNQQLGLMMEKIPQNTTLADLWEILRE